MAPLSEGKHTGEFILAEAPGTISRDTVTVTVDGSTTLEPGAVLGRLAASGKYVPYDDSASDGSEDAAGVLYASLTNSDVSAADLSGVILNFAAEVRGADLVWGEGVDETKGAADLAALGVKVRD